MNFFFFKIILFILFNLLINYLFIFTIIIIIITLFILYLFYFIQYVPYIYISTNYYIILYYILFLF